MKKQHKKESPILSLLGMGGGGTGLALGGAGGSIGPLLFPMSRKSNGDKFFHAVKTDGTKGRADIVVAKNGTGLLIEMKYKGKADEALEQAKEYAELVKDTNTQIFIGCNITNQQEVFLSGDIVIDGAEPFHFDYP